MIWFTADQHLGHANIIKYCNRPFSSVEEMGKTIIENTLSVLQRGDTVYSLGDLTFLPRIAEEYLQMLSRSGCRLVYITGNHDKRAVKILKENKVPVFDLTALTYDKQHVVMCHYAMRVWNRSHYGAWNLHGHSHGTLYPQVNQLDVGVDAHDFKLVSWPQVKQIILDRQVQMTKGEK